jgi:flavin reductase (DIM6/NTAB) family NADH-FMN oxidoreductase RutF
MDTEAFDSLTARVDSPLIVVTAATSKDRDGCLVGFHSQSGLEPLRYAIWLSKANATYRIALFATHIGVHLLDRSDHDIAALFGGTTGDEVDKFAACAWTVGPHGVPLLTRCPNWAVLRRTVTVDTADDHVCFVGEPVAASSAPGLRPLRQSDVDDIEPGHPAEDRATPGELTD